ncbi:MAG: histone-like nucleoid-structuring protein Lsr2, partial [Mycobacteriales bacterium]
MARKVITLLEDDIDGGDAAESIEFSLDGSNYFIDLNEQNAIKLREALAPFVAAARRTSRERAGRSSRHVTQD